MCSFETSECPELDVFMNDLDDDFELEFQHDLEETPDSGEADCMRVSDCSASSDEGESDASTDDPMDSLGSSPPVVHHIEDMVLYFLTQLAFPGKQRAASDGISSGSDIAERILSRSDYSVEICLADRKKTEVDGRVLSLASGKEFDRTLRKGYSGLNAFAILRRINTEALNHSLFRVLDITHEATLNGIPVTKRDIYYQDVPLFKTQKVVDGLVDDLAATFQLERSDLNIRSSSKGLICCSGLTITLISGETICCNDTEGTLIPAGEDIETFGVDEDIAWVLVVEKEAVFQTLCRLQIAKHDSMPGPGILITGKGYPDVATRHIIKSLADALPRSVPVLGMVDGDPFGLDILSVYKYGSISMQHENEKLATKRIKWLGVWASELDRLGIHKDHLLPITKNDEKKALAMLRRTNKPLPRKWRKELQHMLHSRHKAEIEILSSNQNETSSILGEEHIPHGLLLHYLVSKITESVVAVSQ